MKFRIVDHRVKNINVTYGENAFSIKWVFNFDLNKLRSVIERMEAGREFHKSGAEHEKDLSPKDLVLAFLTIRRFWSAERRDLPGVYNWIISERYFGARPYMDLKISRRTLNWTRNLMGNQCRRLRIGVIWSCFFTEGH